MDLVDVAAVDAGSVEGVVSVCVFFGFSALGLAHYVR